MSFHNERFPTDVSWGSRGGPGYFTNIIELDSGIEERVARRSRARRRYDASYGVRRYSQLAALISFYIGRKGPASGFRYKDWSDFTTSTDGKSAAAFTDQTIGTGDGTTKVFQMVKRYTSGSQTEVRNLTKIVNNTMLLGVNGTLTVSGWTVDNDTGLITFTTAPTNGHPITAGCQFDTPVRFGAELDESIMLSLENFSSGSIEAIPLIEIMNEDQFEDDYFYGGAKEHGNISADISISQPNGRVHSCDPQSGALSMSLPTKTTVKPGGPIFYLHNLSLTNAIAVKESAADGAATVLNLPADTGVTVDLSINPAGTVRTWYVF